MILLLCVLSKENIQRIIFQMDQRFICHLNNLGNELFPPSHYISILHENCLSSGYIFPSVIITDTKSLLYLCTWFIFLVWLLKSFTPIIDIDVKHVFPILNFIGIFSLAAIRHFSDFANILLLTFYLLIPRKCFQLHLENLKQIL